MSAFMCGNHHINAIVKWAVAHKVIAAGSEQLTVESLQEANAMSVNARYGDDEPEAGYIYGTDGVPDLSPIGVIKACHCLDYQSCEYDAWDGSHAKVVLDDIISNATSQLPGYDEAAWEVRP